LREKSFYYLNKNVRVSVVKRKTELALFEEVQPLINKHGKSEVLAWIDVGQEKLPLWGLRLGPADPTLPTFGLFAGVHGLERVGSHVALHFLKSFLHQLEWDFHLRELMTKVRLVSIPMVNPGGLFLSSRSNPSGVDIMRNAPVGPLPGKFPWVSGQRLSPRLPWYTGDASNMEIETRALVQFVEKEMFESPFSMALDVHSGFGLQDRLWYPFSHSKDPFPHEDTVKDFAQLLHTSLPHHIYKIEKQTDSYVVYGDPWDHLALKHLEKRPKASFIPWCLEMGSWTWLKKNPLQLFSKPGLFNPTLPHRYQRIMRRHRGLLDIFLRATLNYKAWSQRWQNGSFLEDLDEKVPTG
jgi:hypothetical protein